MPSNPQPDVRPPQSPRGRGFTLVELLVVVTIIVMLVAVLRPSITGAISAAQEAACSSHLRQLGIAMIQYNADERYMISGFTWATSLNGTYESCAVWPGQLRIYTGGNTDVFYCPAANPDSRWVKTLGSANKAAFGYDATEFWPSARYMGGTSYGLNNDGTRTHTTPQYGIELGLGNIPNYGPYQRADIVRQPAQFLCIADSQLDNIWDAFVDYNFPGEQMDTRHHGGARALYYDGHVQWVNSPAYVRPVCTDPTIGRQWNWDFTFP